MPKKKMDRRGGEGSREQTFGLHHIWQGTGEKQCEDCIRSAPVLLKHRTWEAVKFYIKNRITAFKRECEKRKKM